MERRGADPGASPPACLVRSLDDIARVLVHGRAACLLSAPAAASFLGAAGWRAMIALARRRHPGAEFVDLLDCADESGRALEALRLGQALLVLDPASPGRAGIEERARRIGASVLGAAPPSLDMRAAGASPDRVAAWLIRP